MSKQFLINAFTALGGLSMLLGVIVIIMQLLYVRKHKARLAELILTADNPWTQTKKQVGIFELAGVFSLGLTQALILYRWPHKNKKNLITQFPGIYTKANYIALVEENPYWVKLHKLEIILIISMFVFGGLMIFLKEHTQW